MAGVSRLVLHALVRLLRRRRDYIFRLLQEGQITDEARRRIERELDLEEASLAFNRKGETDPPL
jgi:monovalent cation/hydrogen antiporter